jgi:hypothetical protein
MNPGYRPFHYMQLLFFTVVLILISFTIKQGDLLITILLIINIQEQGLFSIHLAMAIFHRGKGKGMKHL